MPIVYFLIFLFAFSLITGIIEEMIWGKKPTPISKEKVDYGIKIDGKPIRVGFSKELEQLEKKEWKAWKKEQKKLEKKSDRL